jgi:hypothetical protein
MPDQRRHEATKQTRRAAQRDRTVSRRGEDEPLGPSAPSDRRAPPPAPAGSHPMGERVGTYGGVITGGVVGTAVGGPLGGVVGAAVGAVAGSRAGKAIAENVNEGGDDVSVDDLIRDDGPSRDL